MKMKLFAVFFIVLSIMIADLGRAEAARVELQPIEVQSIVAIKGAYNEFSSCKLLFMDDEETIKPEGEILPWKVIVDQVEVNIACGDTQYTLGEVFSRVDIRDMNGMVMSSARISRDYPAPNITLWPGYIGGDGMTITAEGILRSDIDPSFKGGKIGLQITTLKVRSLATVAELEVSGLPILGIEQEINPDIYAPIVQILRVGGDGGVRLYTPDIADLKLKSFFFRKTLKKSAIISSPSTSNYPCQVDKKNKKTWSFIDHEVRGEIFFYSKKNPNIFRPWCLPLENIVLEYNGHKLVAVKY